LGVRVSGTCTADTETQVSPNDPTNIQKAVCDLKVPELSQVETGEKMNQERRKVRNGADRTVPSTAAEQAERLESNLSSGPAQHQLLRCSCCRLMYLHQEIRLKLPKCIHLAPEALC